MSLPDFQLGEGDTGPELVETMFRPDGSTADLTGATATIRIVPRDRSLPAIAEAAAIFGDPTNGNLIWRPLGTYAAGFYDYQWIVILPGSPSVQMTWPADPEHRYKLLEIIKKLV